jgi:DNA-directed RNA polymerase specialized sigma54-like protein
MDMKMGVHLHQRLEQRMHLSQQMLQNLELLQLPIMELRELILEELQENPTLDEKQDVEEEEVAPAALEESAEETARRENIESIDEQLYESERRTRRSDSAEDGERRLEMLNSVAGESASLREHLQRQLSLLELPAEVRPFCAHVVEAIDDNGYLTFSPEDLVASLPEEIRREPPEALLLKIQHALSVIQGLEPRGVGARSIKECLLLQLDPSDAKTPLLRKVIENHFEDLGANRLPKIARALALYPEARDFYGYEGEPDPERVIEDVKQLMGDIAQLNPRPGSTYSSDRAPKVYPEVMIKQVDGKYEILLEDGWLPSISINRNYEEMLRLKKLTREERELVSPLLEAEAIPADERALLAEALKGKALAPSDRDRLLERVRNGTVTDRQRQILLTLLQERKLSREERDFLKSKMDMGRKLITAIEQRRGTIYRITSEILKRQMDFFEQGVEHLKPLKMQEVADAVGIHLSTVSRAISEKWVETPRGIFPLKFFFASAAPRAESAGVPGMPRSPAPAGDPADERTRLALMERIREILDAEDKKNPLSDLEIVKILRSQHQITAARRTIAKYREELNIPSSRLRKQY